MNSIQRFMPDMVGYNRAAFSKDLLASLVVFLVAVPLGLGIALASGAPLISGIIACAIGGLLAGFLSGAPLQVSGPAAGLTLLSYGVIQQFGWPLSLTVFALAGVFQLGLGLLGIGRTCLMISPSVVKGMLAGIGLVIAFAQLHVLLGGQPQSSALKNLVELPGQLMGLNSHAALTGLITLGILVAWEFLPARVRLVPGALVAIFIATVLSTFVWNDVVRITLPQQLLVFQMPQLPASEQVLPFVMAAAGVAIVASVESLLCAVASDKLHTGPRARLNQELVAQGAANVASGMLGGLPVTGVIVRTSANIQAGAVSRVSALMHGVWIIVFIALFAPIVKLIPLPALAGLLVYVGIKLVNINYIRELTSHREELIYGATLLGVVCFGLLEGVGIGIALAFILMFRRLSRVDVTSTETGNHVDVRIDGALTFLTVPRISGKLDSIPVGRDVELDIAASFMDHAAFEAIHSWKRGYELSGGTVNIEEIHENWYGQAASGKPIVVPPNNGRFAMASLMGEGGGAEPHNLTRGFTRFRRSLGEALLPLYNELGTQGQKPQVLFITCCDSRVDPTLITAARPGDIFVLRNIGNMVPEAPSPEQPFHDSSVEATLDYAVKVLKVKDIVLCGHSDCGAMKAILNGTHSFSPALGHWLKQSQRNVPREVCHAQHDKPENVTSRWNVARQLENLQSYPVVQEQLASGNLQLHGWYFEIESAEVYHFDNEENCWHILKESSRSAGTNSKVKDITPAA